MIGVQTCRDGDVELPLAGVHVGHHAEGHGAPRRLYLRRFTLHSTQSGQFRRIGVTCSQLKFWCCDSVRLRKLLNCGAKFCCCSPSKKAMLSKMQFSVGSKDISFTVTRICEKQRSCFKHASRIRHACQLYIHHRVLTHLSVLWSSDRHFAVSVISVVAQFETGRQELEV